MYSKGTSVFWINDRNINQLPVFDTVVGEREFDQ
jgi:hypothetical protein